MKRLDCSSRMPCKSAPRNPPTSDLTSCIGPPRVGLRRLEMTGLPRLRSRARSSRSVPRGIRTFGRRLRVAPLLGLLSSSHRGHGSVRRRLRRFRHFMSHRLHPRRSRHSRFRRLRPRRSPHCRSRRRQFTPHNLHPLLIARRSVRLRERRRAWILHASLWGGASESFAPRLRLAWVTSSATARLLRCYLDTTVELGRAFGYRAFP
jgi:hypothetical protein